jgi:hypothetical protein
VTDAVSAEVLCEVSECQSLVCDADPRAIARMKPHAFEIMKFSPLSRDSAQMMKCYDFQFMSESQVQKTLTVMYDASELKY